MPRETLPNSLRAVSRDVSHARRDTSAHTPHQVCAQNLPARAPRLPLSEAGGAGEKNVLTPLVSLNALFNTCNKQISRGFIRDKRRESSVIMVFSKSSGCHRLEPRQAHYQPFPPLPITSPFVSSHHRISPANLSLREPGRYKKKSVSI